MKKHVYHFLFFGILFSVNTIFAQVPVNDNCSGAQAISIGSVQSCGAGVQTSTNTTLSGDITFATPENPYVYQTGCTGSSAAQSHPAKDVWYKFIATGYRANITLTSTFANPNISLYSGTCGSLGGGVGGCAIGIAGSATLTVDQLLPGNTYYIQVSAATGQTGTFNITINNSVGCSNCLQGTTLTVNPLPVNGAYASNTTVNFCFHINQYNKVNTNWLHGVQLTFGSGWNASSLTTSVPTSTSTGGSWSYYPTGIGIVNGTNWGAGWYWETSTTVLDPRNNFGDPATTSNAGMWNFCMSITTPFAYTPDSNLSVTFNTSGDGESGSWSSAACYGDVPTVFHALGANSSSVGFKEVLNNSSISISPNPTNGLLNIFFSTAPQNTKIEVYNNIGALVLTETVNNKNNTINTSYLSDGMYLIKVLENNKVITVQKIVKQ